MKGQTKKKKDAGEEPRNFFVWFIFRKGKGRMI